jgi:drug/metabolite transporter (DMT)-like permease
LNGLLPNVALTVTAFGLMPFCKKAAIEAGSTPGEVAIVTLVVAACVSLLILVRQQPSSLGQLVRGRHVFPLLLIGVLAGGLVTLLVSYALTITTATNRSLFQAAYPAATLLFAYAMLRERLSPPQYLSIAAIMLGLLLMNGLGEGLRFGIGFGLLALTMPLIGFSDVYGKRLTGDIPPVLVASGRNFYGALFVLVLAPWLWTVSVPVLTGLVWLVAAGAAQAIGVWTFYRALETGQASLVASLTATAPLVTVLAEVSVLGLVLGKWQWAGVAVVVLASFELGRRERPPAAE